MRLLPNEGGPREGDFSRAWLDDSLPPADHGLAPPGKIGLMTWAGLFAGWLVKSGWTETRTERRSALRTAWDVTSRVFATSDFTLFWIKTRAFSWCWRTRGAERVTGRPAEAMPPWWPCW